MSAKTLKIWTRICLFNLLVVAALGLLMRYKIGFDFPWLVQKNLQHAHSHFAFAGWVSQLLMVLMLKIFPAGGNRLRRYRPILILHLLACYGMLFAFAAQGYAVISIFFSTLSVVLSFIYAGFFLSDSRQLAISHPSLNWFKGALLFNVLSSVGTFYLAYMMASHQVHQHAYLASVYYYLHFQYNGWFFFGIMGLFAGLLHQKSPGLQFPKQVFTWLFISCFPAYLLSTLWLPLPSWLYIPIVAASIGQLVAWAYLLKYLFRNAALWTGAFSKTGLFLLTLVALCITAKLGLQLGSNIPAVSKLAFGFRTIVIAYLHLVLLGIITMYLILHLLESGWISANKWSLSSIFLFAFGVYANELILGIQGIASFSYTLIPYGNHMLFAVAAIILFSLILLLSANLKAGK